MTPRRVNIVLMAAVMCLLPLACSRPASYEEFRTFDKSKGGVHSFTICMDDTLATYDIWIYTRVEASTRAARQALSEFSMPLDMEWTDPEGNSFEEVVYMHPGGHSGARELYRSGLVPVVPGEWSLDIRPLTTPMGFCGIGIICETNGTR